MNPKAPGSCQVPGLGFVTQNCSPEANCQVSLGGICSLRDIDPGGKSVGDTWEVWEGPSTLLGTSFFGEKRSGRMGE